MFGLIALSQVACNSELPAWIDSVEGKDFHQQLLSWDVSDRPEIQFNFNDSNVCRSAARTAQKIVGAEVSQSCTENTITVSKNR